MGEGYRPQSFLIFNVSNTNSVFLPGNQPQQKVLECHSHPKMLSCKSPSTKLKMVCLKSSPQPWVQNKNCETSKYLKCLAGSAFPQTGLPVGFYLRKKVTGHAGGRAGPGWARIWLCWARWAVLGRRIWPCWACWAGLVKVVVSVFWLNWFTCTVWGLCWYHFLGEGGFSYKKNHPRDEVVYVIGVVKGTPWIRLEIFGKSSIQTSRGAVGKNAIHSTEAARK